MNKTFDDYKNEVELINNEWNLSIKEVAKLKEEYLELDKQCAIERETANGLDYTCENYEKQIKQLKYTLDEIKEYCKPNPNTYDMSGFDVVQELKEILAKHEGKK